MIFSPYFKNVITSAKFLDVGGFCDSVITAYFEYIYGNVTTNKIGKCGKEKADEMYNFCVNTYDTYRNWDERAAYMFYMFYQNIFKYMFDAIEGRSELKMVMIGGHDTTMDKFMNFLDGIKIIPRTHYPHYACNIVIELRKYSDEFYLEFYYNDILKYNETLQYFMDTLDNTKYSNLYNYCGLPSWLIPNTTQITTETNKEIEIPTTQKVEVTKKEIIPTTSIIVGETTKKEEIPTTKTIHIVEETIKKEIPTTHIVEETIQKEKMSTAHIIEETIKNQIIKTSQIVKEVLGEIETHDITHIVKGTIKQEETFPPNKQKEETEKIELKITETINNEEETEVNEETQIDLESINNLTNASITQELMPSNSSFVKVKEKLKKFFKQESDLNLYIILATMIVTIIAIIFFLLLIRHIVKRRKKFTRLAEEQSKNKSENQNNNLSMD